MIRRRRSASLALAHAGQVRAAAPAQRSNVIRLPGFPSGAGTVLEVASIDPALLTAVSRDVAMSVPAIAACRNLIVGAAIQMDMERYAGAERLDPGQLLRQPDPDCTVAETLAQTLDDLMFEGRAYWLVLATDTQTSFANPNGFPVRARRVPATWVVEDLDPDFAAYTRVKAFNVNGTTVDPSRVLRFKADHEGVLRFGARTIWSAVKQEQAADRMSSVDIPAGVIHSEGAEVDDAEADAIVARFEAQRQNHTVAFLQNAKFERSALNAADLQLLDSRGQAATECARLFNVPVVQIGASPTGHTGSSLLYSNVQQNAAAFVGQAVVPLLRVIEATLSLPSSTPRGQQIAFAVGQYLRSDPGAAVDYVTQLVAAQILTPDEGRAYLGVANVGAQPDLTPGRV